MPITPLDTFVLMLGAGFSAPSGLPVMSKFMKEAVKCRDEARQTGDHLVQHHCDLKSFYQQCMNSSSPFVRDWNNIEELYTQAHLIQMINRANGNRLCEAISWVIWDVYRRFSQEFPTRLRTVFDHITHPTSTACLPALITTNYDTLVEWNWWPSKDTYRLYYPGFQYWESADHHVMRRYDDLGSDTSSPELIWDDKSDGKWQVPLIKLHGSTSWFQVRDNGKRDNEIWVAASKFAESDRFNLDEFQRDLYTVFGQNVTTQPAIIPPMLGKVAVELAIQEQWQAAIECLRRARFLAVVGYSFPASDLFMIRLLTEGLRDNRKLKRIWVVDFKSVPKARRKWENRMAELFSERTFEKVLKLYPHGTNRFLKDLSKGTLDGI